MFQTCVYIQLLRFSAFHFVINYETGVFWVGSFISMKQTQKLIKLIPVSQNRTPQTIPVGWKEDFISKQISTSDWCFKHSIHVEKLYA